MSIAGSIVVAILNGLINGVTVLMNSIVNGILYSVKTTLAGIQNIIGIPMGLWDTRVTTHYYLSIPIVFTTVLCFAILIALAFIEAEGLETKVASGFTELENL
ncbi:MAG: hypothetical protein QXV17_13660 [Candidatus Micrarchaeaceae archaeon]